MLKRTITLLLLSLGILSTKGSNAFYFIYEKNEITEQLSSLIDVERFINNSQEHITLSGLLAGGYSYQGQMPEWDETYCNIFLPDKEKSPKNTDLMTAGVVQLIASFLGLGWLPIHRWMLGGYGCMESFVWIITAGGCYVMTWVESIVLIVSAKENSDQYINCNNLCLMSCN